MKTGDEMTSHRAFVILMTTCFFIVGGARGLPNGGKDGTAIEDGGSRAVVAAPDSSSLPYGDPGRCLGRGAGVPAPLRFEALPGGGWDNLRNRETQPLVAVNYTQCRTTADGRFLIPDGVHVTPVKSSRVQSYAEMFTHWNNYTSTLSHGINAHAGLTIRGVGISGQFSDEFKSVKSSQYKESSDTVRVQARYVRYTAQLMSGAPLQSAARGRLRKIAALHELNRTEEATYQSQLLVRDFGTHVTNSVDVGASLVQQDQVLSSFVRKYSSQTSQVKAAAGFSFFKVFSIGMGGGSSASTAVVDEYVKSRTSSETDANGGPVYKPSNFTANDWVAGLQNDLVVLDRSGDPLYYLVTRANLPDVPASTVDETYASVKKAVELYYRHNTYYGCTERGRPNFSYTANVDDGSCKPQLTNYTFGGVYQTCTGSGIEDLCATRRQPNPQTGQYSCPPGYQAVAMGKGALTHTTVRHSCHRCWLVAHCCNDDTYRSTATIEAYWCAADGTTSQQSGYLFGGVFTPTVTNPLTHSKSCPPRFYALKVLTDLTICVSDDYELGVESAIPFAGFYTCLAGNPLAVGKSDGDGSGGAATTMSLARYMAEAGPGAWPHACPDGYSQHLAVVDHGCEVNYCVKSGALKPPGLPPIHRPPFMPAPENADPDDGGNVSLMSDGSHWDPLSDPSSVEGGSAAGDSPGTDGGGLASGAIVVITALVTATAILVPVVIAALYYRSRRSARGGQEEVQPLIGAPEA